MKTNRLNILEALNFVLAGHPVESYSKEKVRNIYLDENKTIRVEIVATLDHPRNTTREFTSTDFLWLQSEEFNAGDRKTIKGIF